MEVFRLLHISDFHFAHYATLPDLLGMLRNKFMGPPADDNLAVHVARHIYLSARSGGLCGILITGDLATSGAVQDLQRALEYVSSRPVRSYINAADEPTLLGAQLPFFIVPGNHDRFRHYDGRPGCSNFDRVFIDYWTAGSGAQSFPVVAQGKEKLGLVAGDFTLRSSADALPPRGPGIWGQGRAYVEVVESLVQITQELRGAHQRIAIIWAIHFPPELSIVKPHLQLIEGRLVLEAAASCGVSHIFCGHIHKSVREEFASSGVTLCCAGSAVQLKGDQENSVHEIELTILGGNIERSNFRTMLWDGEDSLDGHFA